MELYLIHEHHHSIALYLKHGQNLCVQSYANIVRFECTIWPSPTFSRVEGAEKYLQIWLERERINWNKNVEPVSAKLTSFHSV